MLIGTISTTSRSTSEVEATAAFLSTNTTLSQSDPIYSDCFDSERGDLIIHIVNTDRNDEIQQCEFLKYQKDNEIFISYTIKKKIQNKTWNVLPINSLFEDDFIYDVAFNKIVFNKILSTTGAAIRRDYENIRATSKQLQNDPKQPYPLVQSINIQIFKLITYIISEKLIQI